MLYNFIIMKSNGRSMVPPPCSSAAKTIHSEQQGLNLPALWPDVHLHNSSQIEKLHRSDYVILVYLPYICGIY